MIALARRPVIVHLIDELKVGGAQTHLRTMIRQARNAYDLDHRVVVLFGDGPVGDGLRQDGVAVDVLDLRPLLARRRFLGASRTIEETLRGHAPDVVEAHLTWSRLLGLHAAWRLGVARRIGFEQGDVYLNSWKFRAANFVGQRFADRMIVCSEALAQWCRRVHRISATRLEVFHNAVDLPRFKTSGRCRDFRFPPGETVFAAVGTLGRGVDKRTDVLIRALAVARSRGAGVALVVCGDGDRRDELEDLARTEGVATSVRFLGTCDDVPGVLGSVDAFCHAAPFEPFGIAAIEAMASALPVVVPDSGGIREAVDDGQTGLLYPALDHEALALRMIRLHDDPALRQSLALAARHAVEARFTIAGYVDRLYHLYGLAGEVRV